MKLIRFGFQGTEQWGAVDGESVVPVGDIWSFYQRDPNSALPLIAEAVRNVSIRIALCDVGLLLPLSPASRVICAGLNYASHVRESSRAIPAYPSLFLRLHSSFVAHTECVERPRCSDKYDYEAELVVVIGKAGRYISKERAMSHIAAYTCMAENSVRDYQKHGQQVTAGKNFDRSGAIGPWLVTADEIPDPSVLRVRGILNGTEMQDGAVSDLIFPISDLISYASQFARLEPGDVIATGTPEGVGSSRTPPVFMKGGDVFEVSIPGVGCLRNRVVEDTETNGGRT